MVSPCHDNFTSEEHASESPYGWGEVGYVVSRRDRLTGVSDDTSGHEMQFCGSLHLRTSTTRQGLLHIRSIWTTSSLRIFISHITLERERWELLTNITTA